jgi:hypothetical protein
MVGKNRQKGERRVQAHPNEAHPNQAQTNKFKLNPIQSNKTGAG